MLTALQLLALTVASGTSPNLTAQRVSQPPVIDGDLGDAVWAKAKASDGFTQKIPSDGAPASEKTTIRVVYDDQAIYVAVDCRQTASPVVERLTRRDRVVESDSVTVSLDTRRDGKTAFEFTVNASGVLVDGVRFNDVEYSADWDDNWEARTHVDVSGWTAELRIPLRILRFSSVPVQSWGLQVRRYISAAQETDEWAYIPRSTGGEVSHYGRLEGLEKLEPKSSFELRPFVLGMIRRRDASDDLAAHGYDASGSAGLDLKWHVNQDVTFDATLNPDFAQVEADQLILNLTNIETFFPEKRAFFLEGIDVFGSSLNLLYTRRIGRAPAKPALRTSAQFGERLVALPLPTTIYFADKLVGSLGHGWTVGTLSALTAPNDVQVELADGSRAPRRIEPLTAYNAVRLKHDVGSRANVGVIATAVSRAERTDDNPRADSDGSTFAPAAGMPARLCPSGTMVQPNGHCIHDAYVVGADGRWRSPGGDYAADALVISSLVHNGPPRMFADGSVVKSGDVGYGSTAYFGKEGGKHWVWDGWYYHHSRKLDFNDLGYMKRQNTFNAGVDVEYRTLEPWWKTLETHTRLETTNRQNLDGLNLGRSAQVSTQWKFANFWSLYNEIHFRSRRFDDREVGDGTALERDAIVGHEIAVQSDPRKRVSGKIDVNSDRVFDGVNFTVDGKLMFRALPQLDLELLPSLTYTRGEPRFAGNAANGDYVFGRLRATSVSTTVRATYTFTPRLTLQTYAQLFLASGHYNDFSTIHVDPAGPRPLVHLADLGGNGTAPSSNPDFQDGALNVNVVLRWEYKLGSTLFLVYTRSQTPTTQLGANDAGTLDFASVRRAPAVDVLLAKLSYWWA